MNRRCVALRFIRFWGFVLVWHACRGKKVDNVTVEIVKNEYAKVLRAAIKRGFLLEASALAEYWEFDL